MTLENRILKMEKRLSAAQPPEDNVEEVLDRARAELEERAVALARLTVDKLAALAEYEAQPLPWRMDALARLSAVFPGPDGEGYRTMLREQEEAELEALRSRRDALRPGPDRYFLEQWIRAKESISS